MGTSAPKGIDVAPANQGTAFKFNRLVKVEETYPKGSLKRGGLGIGLMRQEKIHDIANGAEIPVLMLERSVS